MNKKYIKEAEINFNKEFPFIDIKSKKKIILIKNKYKKGFRYVFKNRMYNFTNELTNVLIKTFSKMIDQPDIKPINLPNCEIAYLDIKI